MIASRAADSSVTKINFRWRFDADAVKGGVLLHETQLILQRLDESLRRMAKGEEGGR
jgi:hypothetical protein